MIKGDLFTLSGDVWKPLVAAITIGVVLIARLKSPATDPLPVND